MLVISSREFRDKQGKYLGMAIQGEDIVLKSRGNGSFKIVPVTDDDTLAVKRRTIADSDLKHGISVEEVKRQVHEHIDKLFAK
jgi:antitoxin (DNA-binding transcriptional repressor) of toxin-antitoxin stability system